MRKPAKRSLAIMMRHPKRRLAEIALTNLRIAEDAQAKLAASSSRRVDALVRGNRNLEREIAHLREQAESGPCECAVKQRRIEELETERAMHWHAAAEDARKKVAKLHEGAPTPETAAEAMSIISDLATALMNLSCKDA